MRKIRTQKDVKNTAFIDDLDDLDNQLKSFSITINDENGKTVTLLNNLGVNNKKLARAAKAKTKRLATLKAIKEMFCPKKLKCLACKKEITSEQKEGFCKTCYPNELTKFCLTCGRSVANDASFCEECERAPNFFNSARAPYYYLEGGIAKLIKRYKFRNRRFLADFMASKMADVIKRENWDFDVITFVPVHKSKIYKRGFNQAKLLAEKLGKRLNKAVVPLLFKSKSSRDIKKLCRKERLLEINATLFPNRNIKKSYVSVLLVDDILTTGATVNECSRIIKKDFAKNVFVITFATAQVKPQLYKSE